VGRLIPAHTTRLAGWGLFVVAFSALQFASRAEGETPPKDFAYTYSSSLSAAIFYAVLIGLALLMTRGLDRRSFLAFRQPTSWATAARITGGIIVAVFVVNAVVNAFANPEKEQGLVPTYWDSHRIFQFVLYAAVIVLLGPFVEELMFRGVGYGLLEPFGRNLAVAVVGISFASIHGLIAGFAIILTFGTGLAYMRARTGSIYPCILLHMTYNGLGLALGVAT
jgi:membrane protease YdiL (CAAX protease family)